MKKLFCAFVCLVWSLSAAAQTLGTGAYPFATFDNPGFDSVNVGNLNVRFSIPIVSRQGRGLPFVYALQYEGLIWSPVTAPDGTSAWVNDPAWGLNGQLAGTSFSGLLTYSSGTIMCNSTGTQYFARDFIYHDPHGASHQFNYTYYGGCDDKGIIIHPSTYGDGSTSDGSGYKLVNTTTVETPSGSLITPPRSLLNQSASSMSDRNGNLITNAGGVFTDTTGGTALTITSESSATTFTYPVTLQPSGATTASTILSYAPYIVSTNFGCGYISEVTNLSASLPDRVTMADGTFYQFTYEPTPGATNGSVTGRLASLTLPTGGTISYSYSAGCNGNGMSGDGSVAGLTRVTSGGTRWYSRQPINSNATSTVLNDEDNNQTYFAFTTAGSDSAFYYETHRQVYQGSYGDTLLQDQYSCYNGAAASCDGAPLVLPIIEKDVTNSYNGGTQSLIRNGYDPTGTYLISQQSRTVRAPWRAPQRPTINLVR